MLWPHFVRRHLFFFELLFGSCFVGRLLFLFRWMFVLMIVTLITLLLIIIMTHIVMMIPRRRMLMLVVMMVVGTLQGSMGSLVRVRVLVVRSRRLLGGRWTIVMPSSSIRSSSRRSVLC